MKIPPIITAGDSVSWADVAFADALGASVDGLAYALAYSIRGPGAVLDLTGTASGTGWAFTMSTAQSSALNAGLVNAKWFWQAYASKTGVRLTAGEGTLLVKPNLAGVSSTTFDASSNAEQVLKAIDAEILARVNGGASVEYTIGTRSLKKEPMAALMELRSRYRLIVSRERRAQSIANGQGNPQILGVRFK